LYRRKIVLPVEQHMLLGEQQLLLGEQHMLLDVKHKVTLLCKINHYSSVLSKIHLRFKAIYVKFWKSIARD